MRTLNMKEPAILELGIFALGIYYKNDLSVWGVCLLDKYCWDSVLGFAILK